MLSSKPYTAFVLLTFSLLFPAYANSEVAIDGYSPVSYFSKNMAEKGSPEFEVQHRGKIYYLTSEEQISLFNKNPEKYRPRHKICPYNLSLGRVLPLDPTNFKVLGDYLLLFHKSEEGDGLKMWNQSAVDEQTQLERADYYYKLFEF